MRDRFGKYNFTEMDIGHPLSIQSARLSIKSSELGPPLLHPQESVAPRFGSTGGNTLACEGGGRGIADPKSDDETDLVLSIL